jgi:hypothetical protein
MDVQITIRPRRESPSTDGRGHLAHGEPAMVKVSSQNNPAAPSGGRWVEWGPDAAPMGPKTLFIPSVFPRLARHGLSDTAALWLSAYRSGVGRSYGGQSQITRSTDRRIS